MRRENTGAAGWKRAGVFAGMAVLAAVLQQYYLERGALPSEILLPEPCFVAYAPMGTLADARVVPIPTRAEDGFRLTAQQLRAAITPRTKAIILTSPNNPTGCIYDHESLTAVYAAAKEHPIFVLCDEVYRDLIYTDAFESFHQFSDLRSRIIEVQSFSKPYAMTGWRMGYVCGPKELISAMTKLHQYGIMSAPTTSQYAAIEAMENGDRDIENMREEYDGRRRFLVDGFRKLGLDCFEPRGAFYTFPCVKSTGLSSEEFCERLIVEEKVAVIPGTAFGPGGEGYVRACYAASMRDLGEALSRMGHFLENLKNSRV